MVETIIAKVSSPSCFSCSWLSASFTSCHFFFTTFIFGSSITIMLHGVHIAILTGLCLVCLVWKNNFLAVPLHFGQVQNVGAGFMSVFFCAVPLSSCSNSKLILESPSLF